MAEEQEIHYFKNGVEHTVKVGKKELGPTRADLEKEKERKFRANFQIESNANAARLRGEKADARAEIARLKAEEKTPPKKEPLVKRIARGVGRAAENVGPNPFGRTETRGKKGTVRTTGFVPPSINSGFSAGGFPSMESGFGSSLAPKFPPFSVSGGKKGGGTGLGSMSLGFPSFGGSAPARRPKRRKRKRKR